jgi:hypothetical protein
MKSTNIIESKLDANLLEGKLSSNQLALIEDLDGMSEYSGLVSSLESDSSRWLSFLDNPTAEQVVPEPWKQNNPSFSKEAN